MPVIRSLTSSALVALALTACSRGTPPPAPPPPAPVAAPQPPAPAASAAPAPVQSATEQAAKAQESGEGAANERPTSTDTSLERMTALPAEAQPPAGRWKPGVNYEPLVPAQPTNVAPGKVEVLEVMWLGCPHCYALQPFLKTWLKTKPAYIEFVQAPVIWGAMQRAHAHLFYALEALGRPDLIDKAFDTIHNRVSPLVADSEPESFKVQQTWATRNGVSAEDFANAYNSFTVNSDMQRAAEITQRYHVEDVPFIVINGRYATDVGKAGSPARLIELIDDLAASEHHN
ncbi:MAG TPA: thiol:disulfide interchange protein DsbA/DsbL [Steroidobacteraceae bacterium]|nr:thiol:disulfide interchange protein DsbA/DsbL [Steroidobacteraceae bacterium]